MNWRWEGFWWCLKEKGSAAITSDTCKNLPPLSQTIYNRLSSDKSEIRGIAAEVLGSLKEERAFSPLMRVMQEDPVPLVRFEAYKSLLRMGYRDTDPVNETIQLCSFVIID